MREKIKAIFDRHKEHFSGTLLFARGEETIFSVAQGFASIEYEVENKLDTMFDIASVTKVFTAVAVLLLVSEGRLHLDNCITEIVDLRGTKIPADVTIEHLLTHTSGIADDADEEAGEFYEDLFVEKPNYSIRNCVDFIPQFAYKEPNFKAGSDVRYNNCAFVLLGLAIEKLTRTDYRTFVEENILCPAELTQTSFPAKDEVNLGLAEGYFPLTDEAGNFLRWKKNIYSYPPIGTPDGGIYTTVGDLHRLLQCLKQGELLSDQYAKMLFSPKTEFVRPNKHGLWRPGYAFEFIERNGKFFLYIQRRDEHRRRGHLFLFSRAWLYFEYPFEHTKQRPLEYLFRSEGRDSGDIKHKKHRRLSSVLFIYFE